MDGEDNNKNGKVDAADSSEWDRITTFYSVQDMENVTEQFISQDTVNVNLSRKNLIAATVTVKNQQGSVIPPTEYILDASRGSIRGSAPGRLPAGTYTITYQYYPVFKSPNLQGTPYQVENGEADIFDGLTMVFENAWAVNESGSAWTGKAAYVVNLGPTDLPLLDPPLKGYRKPADYEIRFANTIVDTSTAGPFPFDVRIPVNFRVFNLTDGTYARFLFVEGPSAGGGGKISPLDELILMEQNPRGELSPTWDLFFLAKEGEPGDTVYALGNGDKYTIRTTKPFRNGDLFEFVTELPTVETAAAQTGLENIRVVPNPYVTASAFEPPLNPGITSGRGERKIDFTNLPNEATIRIFTSRGDHVITLNHVGQYPGRDGILESEDQGKPGYRLRHLLLRCGIAGRKQDRQDRDYQVRPTMRTTRHTFMPRLIGALLAVLLVHVAGSGQSKVGTTAGQFLGISVGPRAIAMGGAYVASNDDVTSLYWNPGAVAQAGKSQLIFSNTDWLVGTKFRWLGFLLSLDEENAVGVSLTQLDYGEEDVTTVAAPNGTGERWSAQDLAIAFTYSRRLTDRFSMGASVKYIDQRIWNESATAFAFDLGLLFVTGFNDMRLGVSMSNFGGDMKLDGRDLLSAWISIPQNSGSNKALVGSIKTDPWPIPLSFRVGVAMDVYKDDMLRLTLATDALMPNDNDGSVNVGGEFGWSDMVFLRGGYKSVFGEGTEDGLALGAGLKYTASRHRRTGSALCLEPVRGVRQFEHDCTGLFVLAGCWCRSWMTHTDASEVSRSVYGS